MVQPGENEYPKMVYPHGNNVSHTAVSTGIVVNNKEEEDKVMGEAPKAEGWKAEAPKV